MSYMPWFMISPGNHVKFVCFVLLAVSEEANALLQFFFFFFHSMQNKTIIIRLGFCDIQNNVSAANVVHVGKQGNICVGNNVSATMCPRLPAPLP